MQEDKEWEQFLEENRKKLDEIEQKLAEMKKQREILKYIASHPKSLKSLDLMDNDSEEKDISLDLKNN